MFGNRSRALAAAVVAFAMIAAPAAAEAKLRAVWGSGPNDVYAVGDKGAILHSTDHGTTWSLQMNAVRDDLISVWGTGPKDIYALADRDGRTSSVLHWSGSMWTITARIQKRASSIWGTGPDRVYVEGEDFLLRTDDAGKTWKNVGKRVEKRVRPSRISNRPDLVAIWSDGREVFAINDAGRIVHSCDGGASW